MGDDSSKVGASSYLGPYNPSGKYRASTVNVITDVLWIMFDYYLR